MIRAAAGQKMLGNPADGSCRNLLEAGSESPSLGWGTPMAKPARAFVYPDSRDQSWEEEEIHLESRKGILQTGILD